MLSFGMYLEGRTGRFADRLDVGHERKESGMTPRLFVLSNWKDGVVVHRDGKGCGEAGETSKCSCLVSSWIHESGIKGNS